MTTIVKECKELALRLFIRTEDKSMKDYPMPQCQVHIEDAMQDITDQFSRLNNELAKYGKSLQISVHLDIVDK